MRKINPELESRAIFNCVLCDVILNDFQSLAKHLAEYHKVKETKPMVFDKDRHSGCVAIVIDDKFYDDWFEFHPNDTANSRWERHLR